MEVIHGIGLELFNRPDNVLVPWDVWTRIATSAVALVVVVRLTAALVVGWVIHFENGL